MRLIAGVGGEHVGKPRDRPVLHALGPGPTASGGRDPLPPGGDELRMLVLPMTSSGAVFGVPPTSRTWADPEDLLVKQVKASAHVKVLDSLELGA